MAGSREFIPATPDSDDDNVSTSTPFLNSKRKLKLDFDMSGIEGPQQRSLNETVAGRGHITEQRKISSARDPTVHLISSSDESDDSSVNTIAATPSTSEEKSAFLTANDRTDLDVKEKSMVTPINRRKSKAKSKERQNSNNFSEKPSSGQGSSKESVPTNSNDDSTILITSLAQQMSNVGLGASGKEIINEVVNIDDLADQLDNVSIHHNAVKPKAISRSPSASPEVIEVRAEPQRQIPKPPGPRQLIYLPEVPTQESVPQHLPAHLRGGVGELIIKLQKVISNIPKDDGIDVLEPPKNLRVTLHKHQKYGLKWLWWREHLKPYGGILADEMGLGKTVMILALICRGKCEGIKENEAPNKENYRLVPSRATLVVCPPSVLGQWEDEVKKKSQGLKVLVYHGPNRQKSSAVLAQYDVVLTTYTTLSAEIPKLSEQSAEACRSPVIRVHWERVVLDEGHIIRNPKTGGSQAVCRLSAQRRWVVTGTPVHNKPSDMFALVKFLRLKPFDDDKVWESWIGMKQVSNKSGERLNTVSKCLLLRRTKDEVHEMAGDEDTEGSSIPPKTVKDILVDLKQEERDIYDHLDSFATKEFRLFLKAKEARQDELQKAANQYLAGRARPVRPLEEKTFTHIFTLILRLRQCAVLPKLISAMIDDDEDLDESSEYDPIEDMVSMKNPIFSDEFKSAKLEKMYEDLDTIKRDCRAKSEPMEKVVIVSQWTSLLKIVESHIRLRGYSTATISGEIKISDRTDIMMKFNSDTKRPQILLLSLQAGGVGLNLIGANHLFFLDIHWNPQLELQAQDRIHRFGQKKPVTIHRYISRGTIEERVVDLQKTKLKLADGILNNAQKKTGTGLSIGEMRTLFGV